MHILEDSHMHLEYFPPVVCNDRVVVSPPHRVEDGGSQRWRNCVVGYFLDRKLAFLAI